MDRLSCYRWVSEDPIILISYRIISLHVSLSRILICEYRSCRFIIRSKLLYIFSWEFHISLQLKNFKLFGDRPVKPIRLDRKTGRRLSEVEATNQGVDVIPPPPYSATPDLVPEMSDKEGVVNRGFHGNQEPITKL